MTIVFVVAFIVLSFVLPSSRYWQVCMFICAGHFGWELSQYKIDIILFLFAAFCYWLWQRALKTEAEIKRTEHDETK